MKKIMNFILFTALIISQLCSAEAKPHHVNALYGFGDSYVDTGNAVHEKGNLVWDAPYGISWPGYASGRFSDGRIETDYLAQYFNVSSPIPFNNILENDTYTEGVNYAVGSSGVTYANKKPTLNVQVDRFEEHLKNGTIDKSTLRKSVAFIGTGVNDYTSYKGLNETIPALLDLVVDGLAWNVFRLHRMGIHNIMVSNLAPMTCFPQFTSANNYTQCLDSTTLSYSIQEQHNTKLENALTIMNQNIYGLKILLLDQSKAVQHLLNLSLQSGFEDYITPCCQGTADNDVLKCGKVDEDGKPLYSVCKDPKKALFWDGWHLTQAGYEAIIELYISEPEFTKLGNSLDSWL